MRITGSGSATSPLSGSGGSIGSPGKGSGSLLLEDNSGIPAKGGGSTLLKEELDDSSGGTISPAVVSRESTL